MIKPALRDVICAETRAARLKFNSRRTEVAYVGAPSHEQAAATPAMPPARQAARLVSPLIRPGPLTDWGFATAFCRISQGRSVRAARFEYVERGFKDDLITEIDPARLKRRLIDVVSDGRDHVRLSHWFLDQGDWEQALVALEPSEVHLEMEAIFEPEDRLQETAAYRQLLSVAALGRPQIHNGVRLSTPELIRNYFEHYRKLRLSIERHGFLPRRQVSREMGDAFARNTVRSVRAELQEREVSIAISNNGEPVRIVGGHHRTAIAQRIGLTRMPVQVRLVHTKWLARQIRQTGLSPAKALRAGIQKLSCFMMVATATYRGYIEELCLSSAFLV